MAPPKVRFLTKIYHPNIGEHFLSSRLGQSLHIVSGRELIFDVFGLQDKLGRICLDILKGA